MVITIIRISSYPLHPHRTAAGGRDFKRRRNAEERHAGAGVPREARGRRVGRKELRWARKEKKKEDKERKKGEGRGGGRAVSFELEPALQCPKFRIIMAADW